MIKLHRWLLAAAVSLASLHATAAVTDWGPHDAAEYGFGVGTPGMLADSFTFSLSGDSSLSATAVANNLPPAFDLSSGLVQLFKVESGPDQLVGFFGFDGTTGSVAHSFASLAAGDYFYLVSGMVTGASGALYALSSAVTPVPEPGISLMFAAGLIGLGVVARRRMSSQG